MREITMSLSYSSTYVNTSVSSFLALVLFVPCITLDNIFRKVVSLSSNKMVWQFARDFAARCFLEKHEL